MEKGNHGLPVKKGGIYDVNIVGLGHSGEGVGRYQDFTIFVQQALPGELVSVEIIEVKKNYAKGRLVKIKETSERRTAPVCEIYEECGGCQLQHLDYKAQLEVKRQQVIDAVTRIGKQPDIIVHPTLGADNPWQYRNKMQFPVGKVRGKIAIGCFAQGSHEIINTENCHIQHEFNNVIAREIREVISNLGISVYDEKTGTGIIRHVLGRVGTATNDIMAVLVTAADNLPHKDKIIAELRNRIPGIVSIIQNVNPKRTNVIMGNKTRTLWGKDTITDRLGEFLFDISARSFFQVNTEQAAILYNKAVEYARLSGSETVIDAYCGTGTITLFLARNAAKVYGIEIIEQAINDAKRNSARNNVHNTEFVVGDAVEIMPEMYKTGIRPEVIVVDPPRAGCDRLVLETFVNMNPQRIVYVSCNPASLARDIAVLAEYGYKTREIQPVDMFPQTFHVECVALIERK